MKVECCGEDFDLQKGQGVTCHHCRTVHRRKEDKVETLKQDKEKHRG